MPSKCSICSREMVTLPVTSAKGVAVAVSICRVCDRRSCKACGHSEQNVSARRCSACQEFF